jgi:predicted nucleic acid-binding protein
MPDYIFDTTVLSNFCAIGRLELLRSRYRNVAHATAEVNDELRKGLRAGYAYLASILRDLETSDQGGWIRILVPGSVQERHLRAELDDRLGAGEASCLALAAARGMTLVTDDLAARREAHARGVSVTGTLGVLIGLVRRGSLSLAEANAILSGMIQQRYRSPVDRLDEFV